jgi:hypothetical protein
VVEFAQTCASEYQESKQWFHGPQALESRNSKGRDIQIVVDASPYKNSVREHSPGSNSLPRKQVLLKPEREGSNSHNLSCLSTAQSHQSFLSQGSSHLHVLSHG